jgi:hemerythrin-like metal-binding protein
MASLIEWRDTFRTGIASVDHEHAELIALINRLYAALEQHDAPAVTGFLGDLHDAIAAHFALEETLMQASRYPGYAAHKADHERLLDDIRDIMDEHDAGSSPDPAATLQPRLEAWFMRHFQTEDARLHQIMHPPPG